MSDSSTVPAQGGLGKALKLASVFSVGVVGGAVASEVVPAGAYFSDSGDVEVYNSFNYEPDNDAPQSCVVGWSRVEQIEYGAHYHGRASRTRKRLRANSGSCGFNIGVSSAPGGILNRGVLYKKLSDGSLVAAVADGNVFNSTTTSQVSTSYVTTGLPLSNGNYKYLGRSEVYVSTAGQWLGGTTDSGALYWN
jgi:hypothetical protein